MNACRIGDVLLLILMLAATEGCQTLGGNAAGQLTLRSEIDPATSLTAQFDVGQYQYRNKNELTVLLLDGPATDPTQAVVIRMWWKPRAARTPIDANATNATIHYVIFTGQDHQEVGIYSGAGFMFPRNTPGKAMLKGGLWDGNMSFSEGTAGFNDLLKKAVITGRFTVRRDDMGVNQALRQLHILLRERLGYARLVRAN